LLDGNLVDLYIWSRSRLRLGFLEEGELEGTQLVGRTWITRKVLGPLVKALGILRNSLLDQCGKNSTKTDIAIILSGRNDQCQN